MKLIKFRIKNYKSIVDSGDCYFSDKLTILAGKNESGKTSILEALEDFHEDNTIRDEAKPIGDGEVPEVSISFALTASETNNIFKAIGSENTVSQDVSISLTKNFEDNTYSIDAESCEQIKPPNTYEASKEKIIESVQKINGQLQNSEINLQFPRLEEKELDEFKDETAAFRDQNADLPEKVLSEILKIEKYLSDFYSQKKLTTAFLQEFVESHLPYFILFSSFDDKFPKSIPIASLSSDEWAQNLELVSDFSIKKISSSNQQEQINHENSVNVDFTKKFEKYWTQDAIKMQVKKDGADINFWIVENEKTYYPSQRSKGQQWYLAFYVKIVARLQEDKPNIILIDEPGLYLHAKAQKDLLQILLEHMNNNPVIFSTHSPYLITEDNLENVRLVEKNNSGTKILGKIHAHPTADKETLTPILTAIGLGINDSITNLDQKENVVVEGPEDVFYLRAFKELECETCKTNFINGGGATNMGIVGAILEGWGANVYYLYDHDRGKKDGKKKLKEWKVLPEAIKTVLNQNNTTIVDIFSSDDFKKHVLENAEPDYKSSNSQYLKSLEKTGKKFDKVLRARKFLQKVKSNKVTIDDTTKANIGQLFDKIKFYDD